MITKKEYMESRDKAAEMIEAAGIKLTQSEIDSMDAADFGLGRLRIEGAQIAALADTGRLSIRLIVLFPNQTLPEHYHTAIGEYQGKEETVRVLSGTLHFYIPGPENMVIGIIPPEKEMFYACRHEIVMKPGDQLTLQPGTPHWFQAAEEGAVMFCFCTTAVDAQDVFTNPAVARATQVV